MPTRTRSRRVLSGLGAAKKKAKKRAKPKCKRVSRKAAQRSSGPNKGRLKPGCRYLKGDGARCCPTGKKTSRKKTSRKKTRRKAAKKKTAKKQHIYSANSSLVYLKKKSKTGKKMLKKPCRRITSGKDKGKIRCSRKMSRRKKAA